MDGCKEAGMREPHEPIPKEQQKPSITKKRISLLRDYVFSNFYGLAVATSILVNYLCPQVLLLAKHLPYAIPASRHKHIFPVC